MAKAALKQSPEFVRLEAASPGESGTTSPDSAAVDRLGGKYAAGLVKGVSLCSVGEALGHGFWIDQIFLDQIADAASGRLKSRFTHPSMCSDGTGKFLGTIDNVVSGDGQTFGDLHLSKPAHKSPDGDLAAYVMDMAESAPDQFGLSIVFRHDADAETEFQIENGAEWEVIDDGYETYKVLVGFVSPDHNNVENLPHARLESLHAADVVDSPAANPNGLFHRKDTLLDDARGLLDFVTGRSKTVPKLSSALGPDISPERLRMFFTRYLAANGLAIASVEGDEMPKKGKAAVVASLADKSKAGDKPEPEKKSTSPGGEDVAPDTDGEDDSADDDESGGDKKPGGEKMDGEEKPDGEKKPADDAEDKPADEDGGDANSGAAEGSADGKKTDCDDESEDESEMSSDRKSLKKYTDAFGMERGAEYFLKGTSFESAMSADNKFLREQLAESKKKLDAFANAGVAPLSSQPIADKGRDGTNTQKGNDEANGELSGRDRIAAALATKTA